MKYYKYFAAVIYCIYIYIYICVSVCMYISMCECVCNYIYKPVCVCVSDDLDLSPDFYEYFVAVIYCIYI